MGRKRIYHTPEELRAATNTKRMRYYNRHKKLERQRALNRYYKNKTKNIGDIQDNKQN